MKAEFEEFSQVDNLGWKIRSYKNSQMNFYTAEPVHITGHL